MTSYNDENLEPSEVREPSLDELLGEVLSLIDEIVAARLADGELGRRRARIKADADREIPTPPAPGCDGGRPTPRLVGLPAAVPAADEWPDALQVTLAEQASRRTLVSAAERDAEVIRCAARQAAQRYQDAALKRAAVIVATARQEAEQILAAARQEAEQIVAATQAERDQTLATARRRTELIVLKAQAQVEMSAQPAGRGGISGAALVDHLGRDVVGAVSYLDPVLTGMGAVGRWITAALGSEQPTALFIASPRYLGSLARSTTLRMPEGVAGDAGIDLVPACNADLTGAPTRWIRHQDPATRADARAGTGHRATPTPVFPVAPASLLADLRLSLGLDSIGPGDGEDYWDGAPTGHNLLSTTLTSMLAFTPGPAGFGVEYVIGGQALTGRHRETAAQMLAEDAMRIRCGTSPILERWRAHRDGQEPAKGSPNGIVATYAGIGFGLPDKNPATPDHFQGLVAELLWNRLINERAVCIDGRQLVKAHSVKPDPLEPGGDGLVIYVVGGTFVLCLWEIKKHDAASQRVSATVRRASQQLASRGNEYLAKLAGPETIEQGGPLGDFYANIVELWLDGSDRAGVAHRTH